MAGGSDDGINNDGFRGHRGFELSQPGFSPYRNRSRTINGLSYSGHALDQMQNRGVLPILVENAIRMRVVFPTKQGTTGFYDPENRLRVIVNSDTKMVVTVFYGRP